MVVGALLSAALVQADDATGQHFIKESIEGNLAEVKVGELAQHKGVSQGVKDFGAALAKDHGMANEKAQKVAQTMGVAPPDAPGVKQKAMYQELSALSGHRFDEHFIKGMVKDHLFRVPGHGVGFVSEVHQGRINDPLPRRLRARKPTWANSSIWTPWARITWTSSSTSAALWRTTCTRRKATAFWT